MKAHSDGGGSSVDGHCILGRHLAARLMAAERKLTDSCSCPVPCSPDKPGDRMIEWPILPMKRTVAERAHMKVAVRTLGRGASVADWPTKLFQAIIVSPSVVGVDTVMVVSARGAPQSD